MEETGPLLRLGEVALLRGDLSTARRHFAAVLATHPGNTAARFFNGYLAREPFALPVSRKSISAVGPLPPVPGASSEGDTKRGAGPLRHYGKRCNELRALPEDTLTFGQRDRSAAYRELDGVLKAARARIRPGPP